MAEKKSNRLERFGKILTPKEIEGMREVCRVCYCSLPCNPFVAFNSFDLLTLFL